MKEAIKGKGAVGLAIAYYALRGMVSIPLNPCDYNLLFDDGKKIFRIKVISCSHKVNYGIYSAAIRSSGGNQPNNSIKKFNKDCCEIVFVVTDNLELYAIPSDKITATRQISLLKYQFCKVKIPIIPD